MLVSWDWLSQYVLLDMPHQELADRLALSGLNHESTTFHDGDPVLDLEVTSNRGDCLSHLGVAREIAVLYDRE
ncbi:MAG: phenylalanine--tRNA ligase subunit beta, partial [Pirellulaceae bacterium]